MSHSAFQPNFRPTCVVHSIHTFAPACVTVSCCRFRGIDKFDSFPMVMLMLFRTFLGETMFEIMEEENTTEYNLYGNIIVLLYALTATVVLANLLIALISYHFQPEKTESQSKFQMAEILAHYEYMAEHHLVRWGWGREKEKHTPNINGYLQHGGALPGGLGMGKGANSQTDGVGERNGGASQLVMSCRRSCCAV